MYSTPQSQTATKNHLILKFSKGKELDGQLYQGCKTLTLESENSQNIATFPMLGLSFNKDFFGLYSNCHSQTAYIKGNMDLEVEKSNLDQIKLILKPQQKNPSLQQLDLSLDSIKKIGDTNFEQYFNKEKPQIQVKPGKYITNDDQVASLHDTENNHIGNLIHSSVSIDDSNNKVYFKSPLQECELRLDQLPNVTVSKVDGKYKLQPVNTDSVPHNKIDCFNAMLNFDNLNVNYDILNKLYGEEVPEITSVEGLKNQIKVLSQEKDQCEKAKEKLGSDNTELTTKVNNLTKENSSLLSQKEELSDQISKLAKQNESLCNALNEANIMAELGNHKCMEERESLYLVEDYANAHQLII